MRILAICVSALSAAVLSGSALGGVLSADDPIDRPAVSAYEGQIVVRVSPTTPEQLRLADSLASGLLSERLGLGPIELIINRDRLAQFEAIGLTPTILIEDLAGLVANERAEIDRVRAAEKIRNANPLVVRAASSPHDIRFWDSFRDRSEIESYLFTLVAAYPELATLQQIGTSVLGQPIWAALISAPDSATNPRDQRAVVQFNGTQHAREWISPMTVLYLIDQLLQRSESSPRVAGILQTTEFAIIPITNPDGYDHSWTNYRFWRKNRRDNNDGSFGIDLNRNWSYEWGGTGSSGDTSSGVYRGPAPFSEPETTALANLALSFGNRLKGSIDYHSYSQLILWPWGYATQAVLPEPDRTIITDLSISMAGAIESESGAYYTPEKSTSLYPADGVAEDWYQGGTPGFGMTIELRTTNEFDPEPDHILPCALENFNAALLFTEGVSQHLRIEPTSPIPAAAVPGAPITIEARFLDAMGELNTSSPTLHVQEPGAPAELSIPMTLVSGSTYAASFSPAEARGRATIRITAQSTTGQTVSLPAAGAFEITILSGNTTTLFADDFESEAGWTVGSPDDDASWGLWARGNPSSGSTNPATDTTPAGTDCFVTGLNGTSNVGGGQTSLVSPAIAVPTQPGDVLVSADLWRRVSNTEPMLVQLAADSSEDWITATEYWPATASWQRVTIRMSDHINPASSFRVRFVAMDLPNADTVEAAVDGFEAVFAPEISPADINGDGVIDTGDITAFVTLFITGDPATDFNGDGIIDHGDIGAFIAAFLLG